MCGIFGWSSARPLEGGERLLRKALEGLAHRGPDGEGVWMQRRDGGGEIAFGHRRLSIIDVEGGAQPMWSGDDRFVTTFNGEIYNFIELRQELRAMGARFRTESDTEVLLEAYRAWGDACLNRLRGMFAFALYDTAEDRFILARGPFGKKPLFLARVPGGWAFSSEIAPLLEMPGVGRGLNPDAVGRYLVDRYAPGPDTFFADVRKLQPGTLAVVNGPDLVETRYFTPSFATVRPETISLEDGARMLRETLDEAVRLRMRSDAPFGAYLSGGLDSSVITALMARHSAKPISTFSVGFEDAAYSELSHAERVAKSVGAEHRSLMVTPESFADGWESAVAFRGAPVSEASDIPILLLSKAARESVKMVLTGEGADELLAGYPKYIAERYVGAYHRVAPAALHRAVIDPLVRRLPYGFRRLKILSRALGAVDAGARERLWFGSLSEDEARRLTGRPVPPLPPVETALTLSPMRALQLADQTSWLPDNLLERGDRMMMGAGIEGRMPFMDVRLAELAARFPDTLMVGGRQGKRVLRMAVRDLVDPITLGRKKVGFRAPTGDWMRRGVLGDRLRDLLTGGSSQTRRLVDPAQIDAILDAHLHGRQDHEKVLWMLANLELFLRVHRVDAGSMLDA